MEFNGKIIAVVEPKSGTTARGAWKCNNSLLNLKGNFLIGYFSRFLVMRNFRSSISGWMMRLSYSLSLMLERIKAFGLQATALTMCKYAHNKSLNLKL